MPSSFELTDAGTPPTQPAVASEVLRQQRAAVARFAAPVPEGISADIVEDDGSGAPGAPEPAAAYEPALERADLPGPLAELVAEWEATSPGAPLTPIRLVTFGGRAEAVVRGGAALPPDAELVSLSVTTTVVTQDRVEVSSALLLAQRSPDPPA
jgi:hypothetical protein